MQVLSNCQLFPNYPNPFNANTIISYFLPQATCVEIKIYNSNGKEITSLLERENKQAGYHQIVWDGKNGFGETVASGIYFIFLKAGEHYKKSQKLIYLK